MMRTAMTVAMAVGMLGAAAVGAGPKKKRPGWPKEKDAAKIVAAVPDKARVKPAKPRKMLVLSYRSHNAGRMAGELALQTMAEKTGAFALDFVTEEDELPKAMMPENLKRYDAVCLNNSTGGGGKAENGKTLVENLHDYVAAGGGLVGIHSATDNKMGAVFGGFFSGHPWNQNVGVKIDDPGHTLCKALGGKGFMIHDEIYQFTKIYTREKLRVLLSLDMTCTPDKGRRDDKDNAVAWVRQIGKGKVFYCSLGHRAQVFHVPELMQFYLDGIQFALGDIEADTTPSAKLDKQPEPARVPPGARPEGTK